MSEVHPLDLCDLYLPRFAIEPDTRVAVAGSCFAQRLGREFIARGYRVVDTEPPPPLLDPADHAAFGFGVYSARYGNVYSARQLRQLFERATGRFTPVDEAWTDGSRWFDPYRPTIQPEGFVSLDELRRCRVAHLEAVARILSETDVFVFTFGITEAWRNRRDGAVYPSCPGTIRGTFDPAAHEFVNFSYPEVLADFQAFVELAREHNPSMRFVVTVSPVPLTATATGGHVLPASVGTKSILRAVCAGLVDASEFVDYFPGYELVASPPMRAMFYDVNLRTVTARGVTHVMDVFFDAHGAAAGPLPPAEPEAAADEDEACDEAILETFAR